MYNAYDNLRLYDSAVNVYQSSPEFHTLLTYFVFYKLLVIELTLLGYFKCLLEIVKEQMLLQMVFISLLKIIFIY